MHSIHPGWAPWWSLIFSRHSLTLQFVMGRCQYTALCHKLSERDTTRTHTHCNIWACILEITYLYIKQKFIYIFNRNLFCLLLYMCSKRFDFIFDLLMSVLLTIIILQYLFLSSRMLLAMLQKDSLYSAPWIMGNPTCCLAIPPKNCCELWEPTLPGWGPLIQPYWRLLSVKVHWAEDTYCIMQVNIINISLEP